MRKSVDTNILMEDFNDVLDDSKFLDGDSSEPYIADNVDSFLENYIKYCQKIALGRREKIRRIMMQRNVSSDNCQRTIVEKVQKIIDECEKALSDDEKKILEWKKKTNSADDFASVPKEETVKKWLNDTGARNPSRLYLYKIAFALGLKTYFPNEINDTDPDYQVSVNYMFNKIYNQRFCTRTYSELIFIFCLRNGKNYTTALKMIVQYIKSSKPNGIQLSSKENNTLYFMQQSLAKNEGEFIDYLIRITPFLDDRYSSIFAQLEEIIEYFNDEYVMQDFEEKYSVQTRMNNMLTAYDEYRYSTLQYMNFMNLGEKVLISDIVKKRLSFFDARMKISSAIYDNGISLNDDDDVVIVSEFIKYGISEALYNHLKSTAAESVSARFGKNSQQYFSDIINDVIVTMDDVYNLDIINRIGNDDGTYTWRFDNSNSNLSHEQIYRRLRKALITAHFFYYWSATDCELSYEGYIKEINAFLIDSFYQSMYIKNSFDCFFMFCAKTSEPIDSYYSIFNQIFCLYDDYQKEFTSPDIANEFEEYSSYTVIEKAVLEDIVELDCLHPVDQKDVQEKMIKFIKNNKKRDNNLKQ